MAVGDGRVGGLSGCSHYPIGKTQAVQGTGFGAGRSADEGWKNVFIVSLDAFQVRVFTV